MKFSLISIFLWTAFLPLCGEAALLYAREKPSQILSEFDCSEANSYADANRSAWCSIWSDLGVDAKLAEAIIYPELIRYSYWKDEIEKTAVSGSYTSFGIKGPDFSVGHFQMKVSWVEVLEKRWMRCPLRHEFEIYFDTSSSVFARKSRMARLTDEQFWQPVYLGLYLRLLFIDYPDLQALPMAEQVRLCATAYNNGAVLPGAARGDIDRLYRWSSLSSFHTDLIATPLTQMYCYAELSAEHYLTLF